MDCATDRDCVGEITPDGLVDAFAQMDITLTDDLAEQLFNIYDVDGDGRVTMKDFCQWWQTAPLTFNVRNV